MSQDARPSGFAGPSLALMRWLMVLVALALFVVVTVSIVQDRPRPRQPYDGPVPSGPCLASPPAGCA